MRRWLSLVLVILLAVTQFAAAAAESAFVPELETWNWTAAPLEVVIAADVKTHMPYDDTRVKQLDSMLDHVKLALHYQQMEGEQWSKLSLLVDDVPATTAVLRETEHGAEAQFSGMLYDAYVWDQDSGVSLSGLLGGKETALRSDAAYFTWLDDALVLFDAMAEDMSDRVTVKKISTSIKNMGKATSKQTLIIPKSETEGLGETLAALCPDGQLQTMLRSLSFSGKQTLTLWRNKDNAILRADWEGDVGASAQDMREVSLSWKLRRDEDQIRDELILRTPRKKGSGRNNLSIDRVMKAKSSEATLDIEIVSNSIQDGVKTVATTSADLEHKRGKTGRLTGLVEVKTETTVNDKTETVTLKLKPDVKFTGTADAPAFEGKLGYNQLRGSAVLEDVELSFEAHPADWMLWELQPGEIPVNNGNMQSVGERIVKGMAVEVVRRLVLLPQEDTLFLSADLDPEIWEQIVQAAQSALQ